MKGIGKIWICFMGAMAFDAGLRAAAVVPPNNPYAPIVTRNVFDLNPPQPVDSSQPSEPPVKITPNGIMTIFGKRQVLFKVSIPAKPGIAAKEDDYILGEGQRQDDIEVTRIDEKSGVITFNNHGVVQEIPLTVASATTTPALTSVAANQNPNSATPGGNFGRRFGGGGRFGRNFAVGGGGNNNSNGANNGGNNFNNVNNDSNLRSVPTRQPEQQIDPDTQIIMIEAQRELHKNDPDYPPLPITPLTPSDATGPNGNPLVNPSSPR